MKVSSPPRPWLLVAPALVVLGWGANHFLPLMQLYRQIDGFTAVQVDILLASYVLGIVPGFAYSGAFSDRYGRRPILLVGVVLGIVGSIILACSSSILIGLGIGRFFSGLSVAAGMVVGTSWIKELSAAEGASAAGARRASAMLTIGFGGGAGIGGVLAQWGPWPSVTPYMVQVLASLIVLAVLVRAPETRAFDPTVKSLLGDLRIPRSARARFVGVILPSAPWVFGAPALSFAVGPSLVSDRFPGYAVGFTTLITVITLGVGLVTQLLSGSLLRLLRGYGVLAGTALTAIGALLLVPAAAEQQVWAVLIAAPIFGAGYGLEMVSCLTAVQAMATPHDLAGLTAVFYSITYVGFLLPAALAALTIVSPVWVLLLATAVVCVLCICTVTALTKRAASGNSASD